MDSDPPSSVHKDWLVRYSLDPWLMHRLAYSWLTSRNYCIIMHMPKYICTVTHKKKYIKKSHCSWTATSQFTGWSRETDLVCKFPTHIWSEMTCFHKPPIVMNTTKILVTYLCLFLLINKNKIFWKYIKKIKKNWLLDGVYLNAYFGGFKSSRWARESNFRYFILVTGSECWFETCDIRAYTDMVARSRYTISTGVL